MIARATHRVDLGANADRGRGASEMGQRSSDELRVLGNVVGGEHRI